jgi:hypothetical protein
MLYEPKNTITPTSIMIRGRAYLDLLDPDPQHITLDAVAAGLEEPRWCNQTKRTITVADHLLRCARIAIALDQPIEVVIACLVHDAAEAFLRDIPGPIKKHLRVEVYGVTLTYAEVEARMLRAICEALIDDDDELREDVFGELEAGDDGMVHHIDRLALHIEALLWLPGSEDWALRDLDSRAWMVAQTPEHAQPWQEVARVISLNPARATVRPWFRKCLGL